MSPTIPALIKRIPDAVLESRQAVQTIGANTANSSCSGQYSGGTLAGAIVGTFFGTLLIIYLFNSLQTRSRGETVVVEKRRSGRRHRSHSGSGSIRRPSRVYSTG